MINSLYKPNQVCEILKIDKPTFDLFVAYGQLPYTQFQHNSARRFTRASIEECYAWMISNEIVKECKELEFPA